MVRLIPKDRLLEMLERFIEACLVKDPREKAHKLRSNIYLD